VVTNVPLLTNLSNSIVLIKAGKWPDVKRIRLLAVAGILAMPSGTRMLVVLDARALDLFVCVVTSLSALTLMLGYYDVPSGTRGRLYSR